MPNRATAVETSPLSHIVTVPSSPHYHHHPPPPPSRAAATAAVERPSDCPHWAKLGPAHRHSHRPRRCQRSRPTTPRHPPPTTPTTPPMVPRHHPEPRRQRRPMLPCHRPRTPSTKPPNGATSLPPKRHHVTARIRIRRGGGVLGRNGRAETVLTGNRGWGRICRRARRCASHTPSRFWSFSSTGAVCTLHAAFFSIALPPPPARSTTRRCASHTPARLLAACVRHAAS